MIGVVNMRDRRARYDVRIDRKTRWGNPFVVGLNGNREQVIAQYRDYLMRNPAMVRDAKVLLRDKVLGCWCAPRACHGDVLIEIANASPTGDKPELSPIEDMKS